MAKQFSLTGGLSIGRSVFDLSHEKKFDARMGILYPVLVEEALPGDVWHIANESVIRFHQALFNPILHEVNCYVHYFFVPYRVLWDHDKFRVVRTPVQAGPNQDLIDDSWGDGMNSKGYGSWELYLTGKSDGTLISTHPFIFNPYRLAVTKNHPEFTGPGSIVDFLYGYDGQAALTIGTDALSIFPIAAYLYIWNEYYRDENLQSPEYLGGLAADKGLLRRNWEKDYFTSALPWQQRGTPPAIPLFGSTNAKFPVITSYAGIGTNYPLDMPVDINNTMRLVIRTPDSLPGAPIAQTPGTPSGQASSLSYNTVDLSSVPGFNLAELRFAAQTQKFLERNARAGVRYTEFLRSHYSIAPRDDRLDRPEYIGGSKSPVVFNEVLQTSASAGESVEPGANTPQGYLAGHGIAVDKSYCAKYHVTEPGIIMGLMSIMPRHVYRDGIERFWNGASRTSRLDFYFPEFAHISEQAIMESELVLHSTSANTNTQPFGYIGRYDEYRWRRSRVHGNLRELLNTWHLAEGWSSDPTERPVLNADFPLCRPRENIFPDMTMPGMLVNFNNKIRAVRPMPVLAEPGWLDHF